MLSIFSYVFGPSACPPWRSVCSGPFAHFLIGLFVFLVLSHMNSLYILEIKPLSDVSLANMLSHTVSSLFMLMMASLAMQKLFSLMQSHLFIFSFMSLALGDILAKKHCYMEILILIFLLFIRGIKYIYFAMYFELYSNIPILLY